MKLFDAHCHITADQIGGGISVVNGTSPEDWAEILAQKEAVSAVGLHPWKVNDAPADWQTTLLNALDNGARVIGEVGLDQWIEGYDIEQQEVAFRWQLKLAAERNLPITIHCLKASAPLIRVLKSSPLPKRGIHLHAYSGSAEQVPEFAELGAYFSFHAGQLTANAKRASAAVCAVPNDRLLIETDAPDTLKGDVDSNTFLKLGYSRAAELRGESLESLAEQVAANFQNYFLND